MKHGSRVALEEAAGKKPTACRARLPIIADSDGTNTLARHAEIKYPSFHWLLLKSVNIDA